MSFNKKYSWPDNNFFLWFKASYTFPIRLLASPTEKATPSQKFGIVPQLTPASKVLCPLDFGELALFSWRFSDFWRLHHQLVVKIDKTELR